MNNKKTIDYYSQCHKWYKILLGTGRNYSLHYGFHDKGNMQYDAAARNMNRILAEAAHIKAGEYVLDVGCGVGGSAVYFAKERSANVIGLDINKIHIEMARKIAEKNKVNDSTNFLVMDMNDMKFRNNYFDAILCLESMTYAKDRLWLFTEIYKMLRDNGRLIVAELFSREGFIDKVNQDVASEEIVEKERFHNLLSTIGYRNISFQDITLNIMPSSRRLYILSILASPAEKILKSIGIKTEMLSLSISGAYNRHKSLKKNLGSYLIFYAEK